MTYNEKIENLTSKILDRYVICYSSEKLMKDSIKEIGLTVEESNDIKDKIVISNLVSGKNTDNVKEYYVRKDDILKDLLNDENFDLLVVIVTEKRGDKSYVWTGLHVEKMNREEIYNSLKRLGLKRLVRG